MGAFVLNNQFGSILLTMRNILALLVLVGAATAFIDKLPNYITPCLRNNPNLNECFVTSGQAAIPFLKKGDRKYNAPPIDPMVIEEVTISGGRGSVGLTLIMKHSHIFGLSDSQIKDAKIDLNNTHIDIMVYSPMLRVNGKYNVSGRVILLPIVGDGEADFVFTDVDSVWKLDGAIVPRSDGVMYLEMKDIKVDFEVRGLHIEVANLFNGNKALGETMNVFLNENWKEIMNELKPELSDTLEQIFMGILSGITNQVSYDVLFPIS